MVPDCHSVSLSASLSSAQEARLRKALALLDLSGNGQYGAHALREALRAAEDAALTEAELNELMRSASGGHTSLSVDQLRSVLARGDRTDCDRLPLMSDDDERGVQLHQAIRLHQAFTFGAYRLRSSLSACNCAPHQVLTSGAYRLEDGGRYFVLLSLAEAETVRCILHMRQGKPLIPGADVAIALRCIPAHDAVFDCTPNFPTASAYQCTVSHTSFRFFDSSMHFRPDELNVCSCPDGPRLHDDAPPIAC